MKLTLLQLRRLRYRHYKLEQRNWSINSPKPPSRNRPPKSQRPVNPRALATIKFKHSHNIP